MSVIQPLYEAGDDVLDHRHISVPCARLQNWEILSNLDVYIEHLSNSIRSYIGGLIQDSLTLYGDIPTQTYVIKLDIRIGGKS